MNKEYRLYFTITLLAITIWGLCLWLLERHSASLIPETTTQLKVVCTTSMLADVARHIGGKHISLTTLMGPGVDPHIYRARERDVHALASADIIFYNGLHLEGKMATVLHSMNQATHVYGVGDLVPTHSLLSMPDTIATYDPH